MHALCGRTTGSLLALAATAVLGAFNPAEAGIISWSGNTWNHSAFGGSSASAGWQTGMLGGTTTDAATSVSVAVQQHWFGTAVADTKNMSLQPGNGSNVLYWSSNSDYSGNAAPTNYSTVTLAFSTAVTVTGFGIRDVDDGAGTSWQDFISVSAVNGAAGVGVTYNRADTTNQQLSTQHGLSGVLGTNNVTKTDDDNTGNIGFTFAGAVTSLTVTFLQGPEGTSAVEHHILLQNLVIAVPEPSSFVLGGLGLGLFGVYVSHKPRKTS